MHRAHKTAKDLAASAGIRESAAACKQNMARKTARPPILSERAGHRSRPDASVMETATTKAAARVAEAPPIEAASGWASERMARPAVVLRKNRAQSAYSCHVFSASRRLHAPPAVLPGSGTGGSPPAGWRSARTGSSRGYLTNQAAAPIRAA